MNLYEVKLRVRHDCECSRCSQRGTKVTRTFHIEAVDEAAAETEAIHRLEFDDEVIRGETSINPMSEATRLRHRGERELL